MGNLFAELPESLPEELVTILDENHGVRIERIVSTGHHSPDGYWYDQHQREFVTLLRGEARLQFDGEDSPIHLKPGNYVLIKAHQRHRVIWTTPDQPTVWLAVFYNE